MDVRDRRSVRFIVVGGVTAALVGFTLLSDGVTGFHTEPGPHPLTAQVDAPIVLTTAP
jgi:hypothetical protein